MTPQGDHEEAAATDISQDGLTGTVGYALPHCPCSILTVLVMLSQVCR
jgi:hypothetical protein